MRALWRELIPDHRLDTAYAFDSVALELAFIVGPLLAAGLATAWTPLAGCSSPPGFYCVAAIGFATAPAPGRGGPRRASSAPARAPCAPRASGRSWLAAACAAVAFGALEVALTAFAEEQGSRDAVGPLITVWSIGSLVGGLVYGARTWSSPAPRRFLILSGLLGLGAVPLPFAGSLIADGRLPVRHRASRSRRSARPHTGCSRRWRPPGPPPRRTRGTSSPTWSAPRSERSSPASLIDHASVDWALASASISCGLALLVGLAGRRTLSPEREVV